jgi:hypothetical protein
MDPLTVKELIELLQKCDQKQKVVFSDVKYGDFDCVGSLGISLSEDNFVKDKRPIFRLAKRRD